MLPILVTLTGLALALNFPIFVCLLMGSVAAVAVTGQVPFDIVIQTLFGSVDKFVLMAVPFFIFGANIMDRGGMSHRLVAWVESMFSFLKGGLGLTTVASCVTFGAISGSSPATVAAIGSLMYPALVKTGYGRRFALGLVTSTGAIDILIPPSIAMIIFSTITNVSVAELFLAGIGAGLVFAVCLAGYVLYFAYRQGVPTVGRLKGTLLLQNTRRAALPMGAAVLILGGIYLGVFTPTEAAGVGCVYAIVVTMVIYRTLTWRELLDVARESATLTAQIMIIIAASGIFSWLLTVSQVQRTANDLVSDYVAYPSMILLLMNLVLLVAGMFIDPNSAQIILVPLFFPIASAIGLDPVHFGIIVTLNLAIGMYTPPFGLNLFVSRVLFKASYNELVPAVSPFIVVSLLALVLVTWVPEISMFLPNVVYRSRW